MYHAFLIIAHNNFAVLQRLVSALDARNTAIFIHIDAKAGELPEIKAEKSPLCFVCPRVDVRWGDVSQIRCELNLWEFALNYAKQRGLNFDYLHMISGVHIPLYSDRVWETYWKDMPHAIFQRMQSSKIEQDIKLRRYNVCTKTFKNKNLHIERISQLIWRFSNAAQRILHIGRFKEEDFIKTCNWCSLSFDAASFFVNRKDCILKKYRYSFCGDEFFAASELLKSELAPKIEYRDDYLFQTFAGANPKPLSEEDLNEGLNRGFLWARKCENEALFDLLEK